MRTLDELAAEFGHVKLEITHQQVARIYQGIADDAIALAQKYRAENERLRGGLKDIAEHDCAYDDGCPDFGSRHGRCVGCVARRALDESRPPSHPPTSKAPR